MALSHSWDSGNLYPPLLYFYGFFSFHLHKLVVYIIKMQMTESKPIFKALKKIDLLSGDLFSWGGRNNTNTRCICVLEGTLRVLFSSSKINSTWQLPQQPIFVMCGIRMQSRCKLPVNKFLLSSKMGTYAVSFGQFIYFRGILFLSAPFYMPS